MGWQDRDWAKLTEDELRALYDVRHVEPAPSATSVLRQPVTKRSVVWACVGVAIAMTLMLASSLTRRPAPVRQPYVPPARAVLYGEPSVLGDGLGHPMACTDEELVDSAWHCVVWSLDTTNATIVRPQPYSGSCAHVRADQDLGRWVCLGDVQSPPLPTGDSA